MTLTDVRRRPRSTPTADPDLVRPIAARAFLVVGLALAVVVWLSASLLDHHETDLRPRTTADAVLGGWLWYDAAWYVDIADHGYFYEPATQSSIAFFPAYPLAVRATTTVTGDTPLAAIATTAICGALAAWLFERWCRGRLSDRRARLATLLLLVYPYAWFLYGAGYADALCLAATLAAFLLLESNRPIAAGLVGAVATAARPTGVIVVIGLVAVLVQHRLSLPPPPPRPGRAAKTWLRRFAPRDLGVLLSLGGIGSYCTYLWLRFGDPLAFVAVEGASGWGRAAGWQTWLKVEFFGRLGEEPISYSGRLVAQALVAALFAAAVPMIWRRFGAGYGLYTAAAITVPVLGAGDFQGVGRYMLGAFPVFAAMACMLTERRVTRTVFVAASAGLLVLLSSLFARGYYLA